MAYVTKRHTDRRPLTETDEFQDGFFGLLYACNNYRGPTSFFTYACGHIRASIVQGQRMLKGYHRVRRVQYTGVFWGGSFNCPVEKTVQREKLQAISDAFDTLKEPVRSIFYDYYLGEYPQAETAKRNGVTRKAVEYTLGKHLPIIAAMLERFRVDYEELPKIEREGKAVEPPALTPRQLEVLRYTVEGFGPGAVGRQIGLSAMTVGAYKTELIRRFRVGNTEGLIRYAAENIQQIGFPELPANYISPEEAKRTLWALNEFESQVLVFTSRDFSIPQMARYIGRCRQTMTNTRTAIRKKLGVHSINAAIPLAIQAGWLVNARAEDAA